LFWSRFFKDSRWPEEQHVAQLVGDHDGLFINLYKELYYRHLYMSLQPTLEDRFASYDNYIELFNELIGECERLLLISRVF
jgi:translation initiation factor 3 subunit L